MAAAPSNDELLAFVDALLSNRDCHVREPDVLAQAIRDKRELGVMLHRARLCFEDAGQPEPVKKRIVTRVSF